MVKPAQESISDLSDTIYVIDSSNNFVIQGNAFVVTAVGWQSRSVNWNGVWIKRDDSVHYLNNNRKLTY